MSVPNRLQRFTEAFPNEDALRLAIIDLLDRVPKASNIRLNHGGGERGKDILYLEEGIFKNELVACVAKNTKITGSVSSNAGASNVLFQAKQALNTGYQNINGTTDKVDKVIVVCPHQLKSETIDSIYGELNERRERVTFVVGSDLLELFEKHYPEFLILQSSTFGAYIKSIEDGLQSATPVDSALLSHGFGATSQAISSVYIQPSFSCEICTYRTKVGIPSGERLESRVSEGEVLSFCDELVDLATLLDAASPLALDEPLLKKTTEALSGDLHAVWQQGYSRTMPLGPCGSKNETCLRFELPEKSHFRQVRD